MRSNRPSPDTEYQGILYGRRKGRPLRKRQRALFTTLLPELDLTLPVNNSDRASGELDVGKLFPRIEAGQAAGFGLEIGFGGGEHLLAQALQHPGMGFIGCEPYANGVAKLLASIDHARAGGAALNNIRICRSDGRSLLSALPDGCLSLACILFPDPWPKRHHHKRRFIEPDTVRQLARILADGAELRIATDHLEYYRWILRHVLDRPVLDQPVLDQNVPGAKLFSMSAEGAGDVQRRPPGWPQTRYEAKAKVAGRLCHYLTFRAELRPRI